MIINNHSFLCYNLDGDFMNTKVFYDLWQMECCGIPFKVGDSVSWLVTINENTSFKIDGVEYFYDAHDDDVELFILKGIVKDINIFYEKFELVNRDGRNMYVPVDGTSLLVNTDSSLIEEENREKLKASGYVVELSDVEVTKKY